MTKRYVLIAIKFARTNESALERAPHNCRGKIDVNSCRAASYKRTAGAVEGGEGGRDNASREQTFTVYGENRPEIAAVREIHPIFARFRNIHVYESPR